MTAQDVLYQVAFNNEICLFVIPKRSEESQVSW